MQSSIKLSNLITIITFYQHYYLKIYSGTKHVCNWNEVEDLTDIYIFFLRNAGLLFNRREKILDAFMCEIFPFKSIDIQLDYLATTLTHEPPTIPPVIEDYHQIYLKS